MRGMFAKALLVFVLSAGAPAHGAEPSKKLELVGPNRVSPFAGKSPEDVTRELSDREEIRELIATYAHRATLGIPIADLFIDDGAFIIRIPGQPAREARGREALDAAYGEISKHPGAQLPMIHNVVLRIAGDEARGLCSIEVRASQEGKSLIGSGYYEDEYRREGGRWKFVKREAIFHHFTPLEKGWAEPAKAER